MKRFILARKLAGDSYMISGKLSIVVCREDVSTIVWSSKKVRRHTQLDLRFAVQPFMLDQKKDHFRRRLDKAGVSN
jgi:hypothetical protein